MIEFQILLIGFGPLILIGIVCLFIALRNRQRAQASAEWHSAPGTLLSFKITKGKTKHQTHYYPHLKYEYTLNGTRYTSDRISFGYLAYDSEDEAKSELEQRVGKNPVTVYYDPQNPKDAVLLRDATSGSLSLIIIGVALIVAPILIGLILLRR